MVNKHVRMNCIKALVISILAIGFSYPLLAQDKQYTIVFLHKRTDLTPLTKEESSRLMEGHMGNINLLAKEGKLLAAGPFEGGGGLFIMNSTSKEEIKKWLQPDPGIKAERWHVEMLPYMPRFRSVCPVKEPYTMVSYTFIRYDAIVSKFTAGSYPEIMKRHNEYLAQLIKTGNVITEAIFNEKDGGILIMQGDVQSDVLQMDPAVQEGLIDLQVKKLFIAKGSFCEE